MLEFSDYTTLNCNTLLLLLEILSEMSRRVSIVARLTVYKPLNIWRWGIGGDHLQDERKRKIFQLIVLAPPPFILLRREILAKNGFGAKKMMLFDLLFFKSADFCQDQAWIIFKFRTQQ